MTLYFPLFLLVLLLFGVCSNYIQSSYLVAYWTLFVLSEIGIYFTLKTFK